MSLTGHQPTQPEMQELEGRGSAKSDNLNALMGSAYSAVER